MALAGPTLLAATPSTSNIASYATGSLSPTAGALIVVGVWNTDASNAIQPTLSSAFSVVGGTWSNHGSVQNSTAVVRVTLFSAVATGTPGSGAITADFGGDSQTGCIIEAVEYTGQDGTAPLIQAATHGHTGAGVTSLTQTLTNALGAANNQILAFIGHNANEAQTAGGGGTELASSDVGYNTPTSRMAVYHETGNNSLSASWTTSSVAMGLRCEIVEASGGTAHSLAGVANGTSSAAGALKRGVLMAGAAAGTSTVAGAIGLGFFLAGAANGTSVVEGALTVTTGGTSHSLAGVANGTSSVTGEIDLHFVLAGAANGTSSVTGALALAAVLRGESAGTSTVTGYMTNEWILAGSIEGTSSAAGNLFHLRADGGGAIATANFIPILMLLRKR